MGQREREEEGKNERLVLIRGCHSDDEGGRDETTWRCRFDSGIGVGLGMPSRS